MLIDVTPLDNGLAVVALSGRLGYASALRNLTEIVADLEARGRRGILLDHGKVSRVSMAGLGALIELVARHPQIDFGCCALPGTMQAALKKSGLDRGLHLYDSVEAACEDPRFRVRSLRGVRAVLLCAGKGSRVAPLTEVVPKPMLDVAGRPALQHIMDHLGRFGVREVILNPGHLGPQIIDHIRANPDPDRGVFFAKEGRGGARNWQSDPIGSASTLRRLHRDHAAFSEDVIVLCGDALIDLDMTQMMRAHRRCGADVTIAALPVPAEEVHKYGMIETGPEGVVHRFVEKPGPGVTDSRLANTGIYIFRPEVFDLLPDTTGLDIACDLLPAVMRAGGTVQVHAAPFSWIDIGCGRDYARAVQLALSGAVPGLVPTGREIRPGVWAAEGAEVSSRARITGPCHIGAGARVAAGATLEGVCSIGAGAVIEARSLLRDSIVMPQTRVGPGAWAEGMILHGDWAVAHARADGTAQSRLPLDGVSPAGDAVIHDLTGTVRDILPQEERKSA